MWPRQSWATLWTGCTYGQLFILYCFGIRYVVFDCFISSLLCLYAATDFTMCMIIPFPVLMPHTHFLVLLIPIVTFDVDSHQHQWPLMWTFINEVRDFRFDILIRHFEMKSGFEMCFSFGFQFGNKWFGLGNSSYFLGGLEFFSNIYAFGFGIDGLLLRSQNFRVVNNSCTLALPMLFFVIIYLPVSEA